MDIEVGFGLSWETFFLERGYRLSVSTPYPVSGEAATFTQLGKRTLRASITSHSTQYSE